MTRSHDDHAPASEAERIRAELAALGEEPADDDELALASASTLDDGLVDGLDAGLDHDLPGASHDGTPRAADDVRMVATLVGLSTWVAPAEGLLPLERQRVWQRIAKRVTPPPAVDPDHAAPAANGAGFRGVLASLALVAGVALVLRLDVAPPPTAEDRAALESMGQATRAALEATVPGQQDGARARSLAEGYAERYWSQAEGTERGAER